MLLLFLFVLLGFFSGFFFFCVCVCVLFLFFHLFIYFFSRDRNMISIGTIEFRYYVAIIIPVNLGKPSAIRD